MEGRVRVVLAEDHTIMREGLRAILSTDPSLEIVGEASDGLEAVRCARDLRPDLMVIDLNMPKMNGLDALREIKRGFPKTRVLVLTAHGTEEHVLASLKAGADGYVLKDSDLSELRLAIKSVAAGKAYLSPDVSRTIVDGYLGGRQETGAVSAWDALSDREKQILKLVAEGHRSKQIAEVLCISPKTVERHRANLMAKLHLHSVSALTAYAIEKGLVSR